jgi:hypothetical protein
MLTAIELAERSIRELGNAEVIITVSRIPGGGFGVSVEAVDYIGEGEGSTLDEAVEDAFSDANDRRAKEDDPC